MEEKEQTWSGDQCSNTTGHKAATMEKMLEICVELELPPALPKIMVEFYHSLPNCRLPLGKSRGSFRT